MRPIDGDALLETVEDHVTTVSCCPTVDWSMGKTQMKKQIIEDIRNAPTIGGWINNYEWICPACGTSILVKTFKQSKVISMKLSVCPGCGKAILYGKAD